MNDRYLDEAVAVTASGKRVPILTHTCRGFLERFCGLMLKREVPEACGLYFPGCRSIHTCMMRVPIDVVWVREGEPGELKAVSLDVSLKPWRFFAAPRGATGCVEFRAGSFDPADRPAEIARPKKRKSDAGNASRPASAERGMSQKELAEAAGLTPASVSRYVNGERLPWPATIAAMSRALGVEPSDIIGTSCDQELDDAVHHVARNADSLTEAQRAELIAAFAKR